MKLLFKLCIAITFPAFILYGCDPFGRSTPQQSCSITRTDTSFLSVDVVNSSPVYHVHDSIKFYSKISDSIHPQSGDAFTYPFNNLSASIQAYKLVPVGSSYQLNYANIEFNPYLNVGTFYNNGSFENKIIFNRTEPYNTLDGGYISGETGLYIIVIKLSNDYYTTQNIQFYRANDYCTTYDGLSSIPEIKQNKQYWDSVGITSLTLANGSSAEVVNKQEKDYFFVKVVQ